MTGLYGIVMSELNELSEKLAAIKQEIETELGKVKESRALNDFKKSVMDKNGKIGALMKEMGKIPGELRADYGKKVNEAKTWAQTRFDELDAKLKESEMRHRYESEKIDVTMPAKKPIKGKLHPVTQVRNQLVDIFGSMGFEIFEGTEIETDYYNFTALNTPKDHPARDMQDTFYLSPEFLLRTQTSAAQIHVMEAKKPPIKIISPG